MQNNPVAYIVGDNVCVKKNMDGLRGCARNMIMN